MTAAPAEASAAGTAGLGPGIALSEGAATLRPMAGAPRREPVFGLHLSNEITTATQLLAVGLNEIVQPCWYAAEPASAFTCMSAGVERLLKLTYGLAELDRQQSFPSDKELRDLGHDLVALDRIVRPLLATNASAFGKYYVASLLESVDERPVLARRPRDSGRLGRQLRPLPRPHHLVWQAGTDGPAYGAVGRDRADVHQRPRPHESPSRTRQPRRCREGAHPPRPLRPEVVARHLSGMDQRAARPGAGVCRQRSEPKDNRHLAVPLARLVQPL